jgi:hypothetical protein
MEDRTVGVTTFFGYGLLFCSARIRPSIPKISGGLTPLLHLQPKQNSSSDKPVAWRRWFSSDIPEQRSLGTAHGGAIVSFFLIEQIAALVERVNLQGAREDTNTYERRKCCLPVSGTSLPCSCSSVDKLTGSQTRVAIEDMLSLRTLNRTGLWMAWRIVLEAFLGGLMRCQYVLYMQS